MEKKKSSYLSTNGILGDGCVGEEVTCVATMVLPQPCLLAIALIPRGTNTVCHNGFEKDEWMSVLKLWNIKSCAER